jgi:CSLREA domain-containing protein
MYIQMSRQVPTWATKTKALIAGLLLTCTMLAATLMAAPAHATTTFTVNTTDDFKDLNAGDDRCDITVFLPEDQCSLRAAIEQANNTSGADTIIFNVSGTGVKAINVGATGLGPLPAVTDQATINGYTQPGASPNTKTVGDDAKLMIVLEGSNAGSFGNGIQLDGASHSVIKGLVINRFDGAGINIFGNSVATRVQGNFIGTDASGTIDKGNASNGVAVFSDDINNTIIGGTTPAARNLVSGNGGTGVGLGDASNDDVPSPSDNVRVQGNYVGTDRNGTQDIGNDASGVFLDNASNATIGGTTATSRNVISGNNGGLDLSSVSGNQIRGNRIGTSANGAGALGNNIYGVFIQGFGGAASFNRLGDGTTGGSNTIAFNNGDGIRQLGTGIGNQISRNSIFSNFESGIDLNNDGPSANDGDNPNTSQVDPDSDTGPNGLQNSPVISSAKSDSTATTIVGKLNSMPGKSYNVRFFSNPSGDEGQKFIGQKSVTTDGSGNVSFTFKATTREAVGQSITATATDTTGSTSEFSAPKTVALSSGSALSPETTKISGPSGTTKNPTAHFKFSFPDPDATFECSLDGGEYYPCSSPENINRLSEGRHTFEVRTTDGENADQSPAVWAWEVDRNNR